MRVFLTGGTGLVGSHAAELLVRGGHEVVALCRPGSDASWLASLGCTLAPGDVAAPVPALAAAMEGCTHVVHAAAVVYGGGPWEAVRRVNVDGTRNVLEAAASAGVRHAVHVSSVAVYGSARGPTDEASPLDTPVPERDFYARSKRQAETAARDVEQETGLPVVVLRPCAVYGERDRLMSPRIARAVRGPVAFLLGPGRNTVPAVYAGNVAEAVRLALLAGRGRTTYDVGLDHPLTQRALLEGIADGLGRRPRFVPLPAGLVRAGAGALEALGIPAPGAPHLPLGRVVRLALGENPYGSARIRAELGWTPPHRHEDALVRTGRWLREHRRDERRRRGSARGPKE